MKIAIAQINYVVGDIDGNVAKIADAATRARQGGASLLLTTELAISGYSPEDLLLRDDFYDACAAALAVLARNTRDITLVVGHPHRIDKKYYNAASIIRDGRIVTTYLKRHLPNYTVFDEERYFDSGTEPCVFTHEGLRLGVNICADVWEEPAALAAKQAGAQLLLVLNASPYHMNKQQSRYEVVRDRAAETGLPVVYANQVGGQDELVFDGASFAMDGAGRLTHQFAAFAEVLGFIEIASGVPVRGEIVPAQSIEAEVYHALTMGVRDYVNKNGFPGVLLGLSGGIDSALTLAVAAELEAHLGRADIGRVLNDLRHREPAFLAVEIVDGEARHVDRLAGVEAAAQRGEIGHLGLGFTASGPFVPQIASALYRFRQTYPQVELILREQGRDEQIENVRNHQLDIGLVRDFLPPVLPEDMVSHCLLTEDMLLALRDDHPLALRKEDPSITDLAGEPLVLYGAPNGAGFTEHFFAQCEAAGFVPRIAHEARSLATLLGLVSAGFGPTVIARSMARLHVDNVVNRRFTSPVTSKRMVRAGAQTFCAWAQPVTAREISRATRAVRMGAKH